MSVPAPGLSYKPHTKAEPQVLPQMSSDLHQKALQSVEYGNIAESSYDNTRNVWVFEILFIFFNLETVLNIFKVISALLFFLDREGRRNLSCF